MASASEDLELIFNAERSNLLSRNDVLVLAVHSFFIDEGARCVGKSSEWPAKDGDEKSSKALPRLWNEDQEKITLRYRKENVKWLLSIFADGDNSMMTVTDVANNKTEGTCLDVGEYVNDTYDTFESAYKNLEALKNRLKSEIFTPISPKPQSTKRQLEDDFDDYRGRFMMPQPSSLQIGNPSRPTPFDYGRSDLDPFRGGIGTGGGMLFDIPRGPNRNPPFPGNLPRGAVPPGARFDPIGPFPGMPMPGPRRPDPDVGPPPGYDDMFY